MDKAEKLEICGDPEIVGWEHTERRDILARHPVGSQFYNYGRRPCTPARFGKRKGVSRHRPEFIGFPILCRECGTVLAADYPDWVARGERGTPHSSWIVR